MKKTSTLYRWSCSLVFLLCVSTTFAQFPFTETFRNATAPGMVYGGQGASGGHPASMIPFLTAPSIDAVGSGYLRLTNSDTYQAGYAYNDVNVFPSYYGVDATFEYSQYGGSGADGITFFLFDATTHPFQIGGWGGSLGYAQWGSLPGMTGGYIDIGLDKWGNFSNEGESRGSGRVPNQLYPGSVVVRGPASLNWNYIDGKQTNVELAANNFVLCGDARATGPSDTKYRKVRIRLQPRSPLPGYNIIVDVTTGGASPKTINVLNDVITTPAPAFLKFGYTASSGAATDFHEIRNLSVDAEPTGAALLVDATANNIVASATCDNTKLTTGTTNVMTHCSSNNHDGSILPSLIDLDPATAGIQSTYTATGKGTFTVDAAGIVTFTPIDNYTGGSAVCSYQVTDNYGKKSNIAQISFNAKPTEFAYLTDPSTKSQPLSSNSFHFVAYNNTAGETYTWDFGDGTSSTSATPTKTYSAIGIYNAKLITTNLQGCSATTFQTVLVTPASKPMDVIPDCNLNTASKITQTVVFDRSSTDWASSNLKSKKFAQFDTTLGILLGVKIVNSGSFTTNNKVEITGNIPADAHGVPQKRLVTMQTDGTMDFYAPGFLYGITPLSIVDTFSAATFDGTIDFSGTSGKTFDPHTSGKKDSTIFTTSGTMAQYMGKDSVALIAYTNTNFTGSFPTGNSQSQTNTTATDTATIVYFYCPGAGGVGGGGGGGLESKSLGDAIVQRVYNKAFNSLQQPVNYSVMTPVAERAVRPTTMGVGASKLTLSDILQQKFSKYNFTSYITTPTDIPSITNATDVLSIDYTVSNQAKAVSFGTQTNNAVYDHTKAICDRLKGSVLMGIQNVVVNNMNMVAYTLKDADGNTEYAMSFAIGAKTGRNSYTLQSNWLNKDYTADETMYNIQLWAVSPTMVTDMAAEIISNLQSSMPLQYISAKKLPDTYITAGNRNKTDLLLSVTNNQTNSNGYFVIEDKYNELSTGTTKRTVPFTVDPNGKATITLPMSDTYESTISMYINDQLQDVVYMADGTWSYGSGTGTTVSSFKVTNDTNKTYMSDELPVFRNVQVNGNSSNFISVFKLLKGGAATQDLSAYKTLKLTAAGGYNLRVTLVKNSIVNWADQYNTIIPLDKNSKDYFISMDAFTSAASKDRINANDVTTVVFSVEVGTGQTSAINTALSSISFAKQEASYLQSLSEKEVLVYPNPATGNKFTCSFMSDKSAQLTLRVIEMTTGKLMQTQQVAAVPGINTIQVGVNRRNAGNSVYLIALDGDNVQYKKAKVIAGNQ